VLAGNHGTLASGVEKHMAQVTGQPLVMGIWTKFVCRLEWWCIKLKRTLTRHNAALVGLLALTCLCSGCFNVVIHADGEGGNCMYAGTVACSHTIALPFVGATGPEASIAEAYATLFLPLTIVDLPFEVVADTITFPYDVWRYCTNDSL